MCKKILLLLNIFALVLSSQVCAQNFKQVDLERLLNKHPMLKNFDPDTRRFKGTDSEFKSVASLTINVEKAIAEIKQLNEEKKEIIQASFKDTSEQTTTWGRIGEIDIRLKALENIKNVSAEALSLDGKTGVPSILPTIQAILDETLGKRNAGEKSIILNKLPRFRTPIIKYGENGLNTFFQNSDKLALIEYSRYSFYISCLFEQTDKAILFNQEDLQR